MKIKEILRVNDCFIVYIDEKSALQWYWDFPLDADIAAKVFNRAGDLEARTQFLRQKEDQEENLISALRLMGEGVVELFSTKDVAYANAALDTADKFITQRAREVSRRWYFNPLLIFFAISALRTPRSTILITSVWVEEGRILESTRSSALRTVVSDIAWRCCEAASD